MVGDLRRYLHRTPVLQLAAGLALAQAALAFVRYLVYDVVVAPISFGGGFGFGFDFGLSSGFVSVAGRTFGWLEPTSRVLVLGAIVALAYAVPRRTVSACPHCLAEIPAGARACRSCTREVAG